MRVKTVFCCIFSLFILVASASADREFRLLERAINSLAGGFEKQAVEEIQSNLDKIVDFTQVCMRN